MTRVLGDRVATPLAVIHLSTTDIKGPGRSRKSQNLWPEAGDANGMQGWHFRGKSYL